MDLHFEEAGAGTPLVLIHGFPFDHTVWEPQLTGLADAARVIAPDLRGFGNSPAAQGVMTMEAHARDVKQLMDGLGLARAVIGGLSMGGYVALAFADLFPDALLGLMLCSTRSVADGEAAKRMRELTALKALDGGLAQIAEDMASKLPSRHSAEARPELVSWLRRMIARQSPAGTAASSRGMALRTDRTPLLERIKVPALVIAGRNDMLIPPEESMAMHTKLPDSTLTVIPRTGHLPNLEDADAFNSAARMPLTRFR
jgi:3-oxoadipate enol-lactonase